MQTAVFPMRIAAVLLITGVAAIRLTAQSSGLPSTLPTAPAAQAAPPMAARAMTVPAIHDAKVVYSAGMLQITANGSGLNQILRDIARQTGMRISGSVAEERVYGTYGPASAATVLASLIEGTGSNMVFRETANDAPAELTLTPRSGALVPASFYPSAPSGGGQTSNWAPQQQIRASGPRRLLRRSRWRPRQ